MQPMYEYRIIKEEINTQVAFPQNGLGDTNAGFRDGAALGGYNQLQGASEKVRFSFGTM